MSSHETKSPFDLERMRQRAVSAPFAVWISIFATAVMGGIAWANLQAQVDSIIPLAMRVERQAEVLTKVDVMANDIQWIKGELQRQRMEDSRRPGLLH